MSLMQIQRRLDAILNYMEPHWEFVNCHMVNYLTADHWHTHVPSKLQQEVDNVEQVKNCIESVFWQKSLNKFNALTDFVNTTKAHTCAEFPEIITSLEKLECILQVAPTQHMQKLSIKEFLTEKKQHEVETAAQLVNNLIESCVEDDTKNVYIIDAGDGKGYLSSRLALQYTHKVLGIDANEKNTENALKRNTKLQRAWNGLTERAVLLDAGIKPPRRGKKVKKIVENENILKNQQNYCTTAQFINTDVDLHALLQAHFTDLPTIPTVCFTGLHTCGNLAPTCLKLFHSQPLIKILCNIGCCYHLLQEAYTAPDEFTNTSLMRLQTDNGFPLSKYLNARQVKLGRNARMLAAQSMERTLAAQELPNVSLYYRALLEVLLSTLDSNYQNAQVGKLRKFNNFQDYVKLSLQKLQLNPDIVDSDTILALEAKYATGREYLNLFYLIRQCFAPVVESLILLDRLLYLQELNYEHSYLVPIFDAVTSPRHFGIIAWK